MTATFKQFLTESNVSKKWDLTSLDNAGMVSLLNAHAKDGLKAITNGGLLWRGFVNSPASGAVVIDSTNARRRSKDTNNIYQLMMDASPALSKYPSRSNALIASTSYSYATSYAGKGGAHALIPFDGTEIAVLSVLDILAQRFDSPLRTGHVHITGMHPFPTFLDSIGLKAKGADNAWTFTPQQANAVMAKYSAEELFVIWDMWSGSRFSIRDTQSREGRAFIATAAKELLASGPTFPNSKDGRVYALFKDNPTSRWTAISGAMMTPATLDISLVKYGGKMPVKNEVWFSGKAIVIPIEIFKNVVKVLHSQGHPIHSRYNFCLKP